MKIIQFIPYYPPHIWWLETHAKERSLRWMKKWYWKVINVVSSLWQEKFENLYNDKIIFDWVNIWYRSDWIEILVFPSFDIIKWFFVPKFWQRSFWKINSYLKKQDSDVVVTRTRFFLTTFWWWVFAKIYKKKWVHIEHGSGFLKLNTWRKNLVWRIYDYTLWRWAFVWSDILIPISNTCAKFIYDYFTKRPVKVIYRWMDFVNKEIDLPCENLKEKFPWKIIVWFVGRLFRWKNAWNLIQAYYQLDSSLKDKIQLVIIWNWEDYDDLKAIDKDNLIYFMWEQKFEQTILLQKQFDVNYHTSSPWWGLASTLLQALWLGPLIVATPYEGANEVITDNYNWILLKDSSVEEMKRGLQMIIGDCWRELKIENWKLKIERLKIENWKSKSADDKSIWNWLLQERDKFAVINKDLIRQQFDWDRNIEKYFDLFSKLEWWKF